MVFIEWSASIEVGDPLIDADHRTIFDLINGLHDRYEAHVPITELADTFNYLLGYVYEHFEREERLMEELSYPEQESHRSEHRALEADVAERALDVATNLGATGELIGFLRAWLLFHIMASDRRLASFANAARGRALGRPSSPQEDWNSWIQSRRASH